MAELNDNIKPSEKLQAFLNYSKVAAEELPQKVNDEGFFKQAIPDMRPLENKTARSFIDESNIIPETNETQNLLSRIHEELLSQKESNINPIIEQNQQQRLPLDTSELFKPSQSVSAEEGMRSISDIKDKQDKLSILENQSVPNVEENNSNGGGGTSVNNNTTNTTNVTQVTPDYLLALRMQYHTLPPWRQYTG